MGPMGESRAQAGQAVSWVTSSDLCNFITQLLVESGCLQDNISFQLFGCFLLLCFFLLLVSIISLSNCLFQIICICVCKFHIHIYNIVLLISQTFK